MPVFTVRREGNGSVENHMSPSPVTSSLKRPGQAVLGIQVSEEKELAAACRLPLEAK